MFKKRRIEEKTTTSVIGKETEFKGSIKDKGSIRIDGSFQGEIETEGNLIIGEDAVVEAKIRAKSVIIGGKVVGDINCEEKVELFSSGSLEGKVMASDLTIAEGAFFNGECRMTPEGKGNRFDQELPSETKEE